MNEFLSHIDTNKDGALEVGEVNDFFKEYTNWKSRSIDLDMMSTALFIGI